MKKTLITLSTITLIVGGLIGCGVDNEAARDDNRTANYNANNGPVRGLNEADPTDDAVDDTTPPDDTAGDTTPPDDTADDMTPGDDTADNTADDTADDTTPGDVVMDDTDDDVTPGDDAAEADEDTDLDFPDVSAGHTHYADIQWAVENGIFKGHGDNTFGPEQSLTRAQASSLVKRIHDTFIAADTTPADDTDTEADTDTDTDIDADVDTNGDANAGE